MTFSFDENLADDVSLTRFHIGDTDDAGHFLEDETIQYHIDAGTVGSAVIACIRFIIMQLSRPDFKQDWLSVDNASAKAGYETMLKIKAQEFGIRTSSPATSIEYPHRADSYENDDGVYTDPDGA